MKLLSVKNTSMYPTIGPDDKVLFSNKKEYNIGDIIIFKSINILVAHRLLKKNKSTLITKGDNNIKPEIIKKKEVIGKILFINKMKFQNNFFQKLIVFFSLIQPKLIFFYFEKNNILRKLFKILTNPILYIYCFNKIYFKK